MLRADPRKREHGKLVLVKHFDQLLNRLADVFKRKLVLAELLFFNFVRFDFFLASPLLVQHFVNQRVFGDSILKYKFKKKFKFF